jgi:hypothetical protein
LKTPVPTLAATAATIIWLVRRGAVTLFDEMFLALPIVAFLAATSFVRDDLGLRYILPIYPLLYVLIGGMAADTIRWTRERMKAAPWRARFAGAGAVSLTVMYLGGTLAIYPDYLAFFNGLFCRPGEGIRYLDDSNIDWGQDFKQLARYLHEHDIQRIRGVYNPLHLAPYAARYYGVAMDLMTLDEIREPQSGWYAVSAHLLQRPTVGSDSSSTVRFDWLDRFTPVAKIGYSIYLYHFE